MNVRQKHSHWRWLVLAAVLVGTTIGDGLTNTTGVFLLAWKEYFDCPMADVSIIAAANMFAYQLGCLSGGLYLEKLGYRKVVIIGGTVSACVYFLASFSATKLLLVFTFGILPGLFSGTTFPAFNVAVATYFQKNFSTVRGISCSGIAAGLVFLPPFLQFLKDMYGWQGALQIYSALIGNVLVCGMVLRPESLWTKTDEDLSPRRRGSGSPDDPNNSQDGGDDGGSHSVPDCTAEVTNATGPETDSSSRAEEIEDHGVFENSTTSTTQVANVKEETDSGVENDNDVARAITLGLTSRRSAGRWVLQGAHYFVITRSCRALILLFTEFCFGACYSAVVNHLIASIVYRGTTAQSAAFIMSFLGGGSFLGRMSNGFAVDSGCISASKLYMVSLMSCGAGVVIFRVVHAYWMYAASCVVIGASSGVVISLQVVLSRLYVGRRYMGNMMGLAAFSFGVGGAIGPIVAGWLFDATQNYDYVFYPFGFVLIICSFVYILEPRLQRIETKRAKNFIADTFHGYKMNHVY